MSVLLIALLGLAATALISVIGLILHGLWLIALARRQRRGLPLVVTQARWLNPNLLRLHLRHRYFLPLPRFAAGQYLTLLGTPAGARPVRRCYSLAAWTAWPWRYELCIKREEHGRMSNWLSSHACAGAPLYALPPRGHFILRAQHGPNLLLLAGGVGITPLRAMLHAWQQRPNGRRVTLLYAGRTLNDLAYHYEFSALANQRADFDYQPLLSQDPTAVAIWQGRLDGQRLQACLTSHSEVFICASTQLLQHALALLAQQGVPAERVHYETFSTELAAGSGEHVVHWQGQPFHYQGQPSLLAALREQGVDLAADCWGGHCGSCRVRCQGEVEWRIQPSAPLAEAEILACCCIPREALRLGDS